MLFQYTISINSVVFVIAVFCHFLQSENTMRSPKIHQNKIIVYHCFINHPLKIKKNILLKDIFVIAKKNTSKWL